MLLPYGAGAHGSWIQQLVTNPYAYPTAKEKKMKASVATEKQRYMHHYQIEIHFNAQMRVKYKFFHPIN